MKRKEFISVTSKAIFGMVVTSSLLLSCSSHSLDLKKIIGKDKSILENLDLEYDGKFSCYSSEKFNYEIDGIKLFIFCVESKIVGFSIKIKNKHVVDSFDIPTTAKIKFDNIFGVKKEWSEKNLYKSLCVPKNYQNVESFTFYSEYLSEAYNVVW